MLQGLKVIVSPYADRWERFQNVFPRSKKKRQRKKFEKDARNYLDRLVDELLLVGDTVVVGPLTKKKLDDAIELMAELKGGG